MTKLINFVTVICICTLSVETQIAFQALNPDTIYFADNIPPFVNADDSRNNNVEIEKQRVDSEREVFGSRPNFEPPLGPPKLPLPITLQRPAFNPQLSSSQPPRDLSGTRATVNNLNRVNSLPVPQPNPSRNMSNTLVQFGVNLLQNIDSGNRNVVISPYSIASLLALLQQGAFGKTQVQISDALQQLPEPAADAFKLFNEVIEARSSRNILKVANNLFIADAFELNPAFKRVAVHYFGSQLTPIQFSSPQAVKTINGWVASKTNNKIQELLGPDSVDDNTQLVLVNAVYFKGQWMVRFKPESTLPALFYLNQGPPKTVPFMRIRKIFRAGIDKNNNAQVIILPFESEQYSMMFVLPSPVSSLHALVASLSEAQLASYFEFTPKEVEIHLPKFSIRSDTGLNNVLQKMGVRDMFGGQAELGGVGAYRGHSPQVSDARHSAAFSIDEDGGAAAAASSFAVVALSYDDPSMLFNANRPFLAVIWDQQLSLPLFMAKIQDPTK